MISFKNYFDENINYYNSLTSKTVDMIVNESDLFVKHGKTIDSILYKMSLHNNRIKNHKYVNESDEDVLFDIDEQFASRDILITIANDYMIKECEEFICENNLDIYIDESLDVNESVKKIIGKVNDFIEKSGAKEKFIKFSEKISAFKEFIKDVLNNPIKSAKELVNKITLLFLKLSCSLAELIHKINGEEDDEELIEFLDERVKAAYSDEKTTKENIYESFGLMIANDAVLEDEKSSDEYDQAQTASRTTSGTWLSKLKGKAKATMNRKALIKMFLQMMAYYGVTVLLPAIIGLAAGPVAAAIVEVIAKILWASTTAYKQIKKMIEDVKSDEWKEMSKWSKVIRWLLFLISMIGSAYTMYKSLSNAINIAEKIINNLSDEILPSKLVQNVMKILNDFWKSITGENASGYDALLKAQQNALGKLDKITVKEKRVVTSEDMDKCKSEIEARYKELYKSGDLTSTNANDILKNDPEIKEIINKYTPPGYKANVLNIFHRGGWEMDKYYDWLKDHKGMEFTAHAGPSGEQGLYSKIVFLPKDIDVDKLHDVLIDAGAASSTDELLGTGAEEVTKTIEKITPVSMATMSFCPFAGLFPIISKYMTGGFVIKLGTGKGSYKYYIEAENVEHVTYDEFLNDYRSYNESAISKLEKTINKINKSLKDEKERLENESSLKRSDKKRLKAINKRIEMMKQGKSEYELIVFKGKHITTKKKDDSVSESKVEVDDKVIPVFFISPILIALGDLAKTQSNRGPRMNLNYFKGMFAQYEFLPVKNGMSIEEIYDLFKELIKESIRATYNVCTDIPCYKDGKKFVENEESDWKGKKRPDFGMFKNDEITDIFNNGDDIDKYFSGKYYTGKNAAHGKETEYSKEMTSKRVDQITKDLKDEDIYDFVKNSDTLSKKLLTDDGEINKDEVEKISDMLIRVDKGYARGKKKKGLFSKLKDWLFGKSDDDKYSGYDAEDLQKLALKLAKKHKNRRKKISESYDYDTYESDIEDNIYYENLISIVEGFVEFCDESENETYNEQMIIIENDTYDTII